MLPQLLENPEALSRQGVLLPLGVERGEEAAGEPYSSVSGTGVPAARYDSVVYPSLTPWERAGSSCRPGANSVRHGATVAQPCRLPLPGGACVQALAGQKMPGIRAFRLAG